LASLSQQHPFLVLGAVERTVPAVAGLILFTGLLVALEVTAD
jgi:hypothetical protein